MALQLVEVAKVLYPAMLYEGLQRLLRQSLDLHAGLAAEVDELADQPGRTGLILTVKLPGPAAALADPEHTAAARADIRYWTAAALGHVFRNLRDNHVCLIDSDNISRPRRQVHEVIQVMEICMVHRGAINLYIVEYPGEADHAGSGGSYLQSPEFGGIPGVRPFVGNQPVLVMAGGAQGTAIGQVIELENQTIRWVCVFLGLILIHRLLDYIFRGAGCQN